jgi:predicted esterase
MVSGDERVIGCRHAPAQSWQLTFKDDKTHRVAIYCIDWNTKERKQKIDVVDAKSGKVLDTRKLQDFSEGRYLVWDLSGDIKLTFTLESGRNAVLSGMFFGERARTTAQRTPKPPPAPPSAPGFHKLVHNTKIGDASIKMPYLLYLPADYFTSKETYPLVMFLHGVGEAGTNLEAMYIHGPAAQMRDRKEFPEKLKFIILSPQCTPGRVWDTPGSSTAAIQILDLVSEKYRVDKDRCYVTGLSNGGKGTWVVAEEAPDRFAAVVPMDAFAVLPEVAAQKLAKTTTWIIVGDSDGDHTTGSKKMYETLKAAGADTYITVVKNCGHGAWGHFFPRVDLYEWMFKHKRGADVRVPIPQ